MKEQVEGIKDATVHKGKNGYAVQYNGAHVLVWSTATASDPPLTLEQRLIVFLGDKVSQLEKQVEELEEKAKHKNCTNHRHVPIDGELKCEKCGHVLWEMKSSKLKEGE